MDAASFFHLTGARSGALGRPDGLQPALFARFADLAKLRYDFPLVLLASDGAEPFVAALSGIVDELVAKAAPAGPAGERTRRAVLRLEREIRAMVADGETGTLTSLWTAAAERLATRGGTPLAVDLAKVRGALDVDGEVVGCDATMPARLVTQAWRAIQQRKARTMRTRIDALAVGLADLVRADHLRSGAGRTAAALRAGVGVPHEELFDFELMARLLSRPSGASALSDARRARIERTLGVLRGQRFFAAEAPLDFAFDRVDDALDAYRGRLDAMAGLVRGIAVAELELRGSYVEATHDEYFGRFDRRSVAPEDLALFPDYLVRLEAGAGEAEGRARIVEGLTSGAPLKILFVTDDALGLGGRLATTAMGLGDAFVLQSSAAQLYRVRDRVRAAIEFRGPALLSVYAVPDADRSSALPPYLVAAAATESRAFPTFSYDPSAGTDWAQRFGLHDDPQPERVWPQHELRYADAARQRVVETTAFTLADFALCDPRRADDFARIPRERWSDDLVPVADQADGPSTAKVPFIYAVDGESGLHRLVVSEGLAAETQRCAQAWRRLRELEGLRAERVAAAIPAAVAPAAAAAAPADAPAVTVDAPAPETGGGVAVAVETAPSPDEPYVETPRCTTCNECTNLNPRMFAYNGNKQAYIKDPAAGTFRELVEAAEGCQVAIIHPGRPRDPNEPGLDELLKRAESFR